MIYQDNFIMDGAVEFVYRANSRNIHGIQNGVFSFSIDGED